MVFLVATQVMLLGGDPNDVSCDCENSRASCVCDCPGGGTVSTSFTATQLSFQYNNCTTNDDLVYNGSMSVQGFDAQPAEVVMTFNMTTFGSCSNFVGSTTVQGMDSSSEACSGTFNATCDGQQLSCNVRPDCQSCE